MLLILDVEVNIFYVLVSKINGVAARVWIMKGEVNGDIHVFLGVRTGSRPHNVSARYRSFA